MPEASELMSDFELIPQAAPSYVETFGLSILEGMAAAKPVVATRVGGIPEVMVDGETGLLVPPGEPPALANARLQILNIDRWRWRWGKLALFGQENTSISANNMNVFLPSTTNS